jgi:hypothetical protein
MGKSTKKGLAARAAPQHAQRVSEAADYMFANPAAKRRHMLVKFGERWGVSRGTFDRVLAEL